jgi:hypothetical protein
MMTGISLEADVMLLILGTSHEQKEELIQLKFDAINEILIFDQTLSSGLGYAIAATGENGHIYAAGEDKK